MKFFLKPGKKDKYKAAIFMSGTGSNAEKLIQSVRENSSWSPELVVTDAPSKSRAREIADRYCIPLIQHDIAAYYKDRGETRVSLMTENGRKLREDWTNELRKKIAPYKIDFGILAGFFTLCNISADFPCLNVHPGDLTVEKDGKRIFTGLNTVPVERAILDGCENMRSSVIVAQSFSGQGGEMDSGPILAVSAPVKIELNGMELGDLRNRKEARPPKKPAGGYLDTLEFIALDNQERLKKHGDWTIFPVAVEEFAAGHYALDDDGCLMYLCGNKFERIISLEISRNSIKPIFPI